MSVAIGQGFNLVTPVQMALLAAAVGNGGIRYHPNLIYAIQVDPRDPPQHPEPRIAHQLTIGADTMALVHNGLWGVVNGEHGTARASRLGRVAYSGKTGTAQVVGRPKNQEPGDGQVQLLPKDHAWFVAYGPSVNPLIAVAVIIEHGEHGSWAAPLASEIIRTHLGLPEDEDSRRIEKRIEKIKQDLQAGHRCRLRIRSESGSPSDMSSSKKDQCRGI